MGFSRQEYWSGLLFPSPGDLPNPGIEPWSPVLQADSLPSESPRKPIKWHGIYISIPCTSFSTLVEIFKDKHLESIIFSNPNATEFRKYKINISLIPEALNVVE